MTEKIEWTEVKSGEVFIFDKVGLAIEGKLAAIRDGQFDRETGQRSKIYDIETAEGLKTVFGTSFLESRVPADGIGKFLKIEFIEEQPPKIRGYSPMKVFKVFTGK